MKKDNENNLKIHTLLSALTIIFGFALLIFMIVVEDEPGAIPLLLIVCGAGWYFITRHRIQTQQTSRGKQK